MIRATFALIMGVSVVAFASPAAAQEQNSRFTKNAGPEDAAAVFESWARCMADLDAKWVQRLLETVPTSALEEKVFDQRMSLSDRCLGEDRLIMDGKQLSFSMVSGRGALARALAVKTLKTGQEPAPGAATAWLTSRVAAYSQPASLNKGVLVGHDLAACLADQQWPLARATVTAVTDKEEAQAWSALMPKLGGCMTTGATMRLNRPLLRLLVSEGVYHAVTFKPAAGLAQ